MRQVFAQNYCGKSKADTPRLFLSFSRILAFILNLNLFLQMNCGVSLNQNINNVYAIHYTYNLTHKLCIIHRYIHTFPKKLFSEKRKLFSGHDMGPFRRPLSRSRTNIFRKCHSCANYYYIHITR